MYMHVHRRLWPWLPPFISMFSVGLFQNMHMHEKTEQSPGYRQAVPLCPPSRNRGTQQCFPGVSSHWDSSEIDKRSILTIKGFLFFFKHFNFLFKCFTELVTTELLPEWKPPTPRHLRKKTDQSDFEISL